MRKAQRGSFIIWILLAVALFTGMAINLMSGGGDIKVTERQRAENVKIGFYTILGQLQKCQALQTSGSGNGLPTAVAWTAITATSLTCPANSTYIFSFGDGVILPDVAINMTGYQGWYYINTGGVAKLALLADTCGRLSAQASTGETEYAYIVKRTPLRLGAGGATAHACGGTTELIYTIAG